MQVKPTIDRDAKIYVAGHRGMVGSAIVRRLQAGGYTNILTSKARKLLGWTPKTTFDELVSEMVREDLKSAEKDELVKSHGHSTFNYRE
jgi:nucleoside-diphosphate-sugar epimerase